jgi:sulfopyruvate decarboxylase TPP-binding subunit
MDYHLPVCMMVGLQGKVPDETVLESASYGVRIVPPILDVMALKHIGIDSDADTQHIAPAIDTAYETSDSLCFLIGQTPVIAGGHS